MNWIDTLGQRPQVLVSVAGASLVLNLVLFGALLSRSGGTDEASVVTVQEAEVAALEVGGAPVVEDLLEPVAPAALPSHLQLLRAEVDQSMARTFQVADPEKGDVINAVAARLFWWDLDLRSDLQRGDEVAVLYRWDGDLPVIEAATYESKKLGRTITAYRYQATGDGWTSWWSADGEEVPYRLNVDVMADYEQITALINSRVRHHGIDFKAPVGTPILTPKAGTVVRTNWNTKYNGNGVEVRYGDGTLGRFLHLSSTDVKEGQHLSAGAKVGLCGNTGRSTASHLHYELEKDGRVVDPLEYHGTHRRTLPAADRAGFEAERARLDALLNTST
ncbi:MAG: M23 family metallopeptidase [Deltaproteobacteria bacterium]|nr:M23 family metallopeptidase [Deltaproteobacteria bacterium]